MLTYILFFFYLFCGTILLHIFIRWKIFPFTIYHSSAVLLFKVFMGCFYGWVFLHYYGGDDTWNFFIESKEQTAVLLRNPREFFREFLPAFSFQVTDSHGWNALVFYINHFERWFMIKGLAILNLLSGKNYYVNVLLFEFLTIPGPLLLFKLLAREFPHRTGMYFLLVFFIPSVIFWCSGIRAETLLLLFMVMLIYNGKTYATKPGFWNSLGLLTGFFGMILIRYQFLLVFLPAWIAYTISLQKQKTTPFFFNRIFLVLGILFMVSLFLPPAWQLSRPLQQKQEEFFLLHGNTRYALDTLKPGPVSFLKILPQAFANSALRPFPWEGKNLLQSVSSAETLFLLAGLLFFFLSAGHRREITHPLYWLFLYYGISQLLAIGYTVPFPGAIVRYRSIAYLFLILFLYGGNPLLQQKLRYWIFKLH